MKYSIAVTGGGLSGVAAAVSGARENVNGLLVAKTGCPGDDVGTTVAIAHKINSNAQC